MTRSGETADDIDREGAKTVKINGTDVSVYKARQWNVVIGNASVSNDSTWARGSPVPVLLDVYKRQIQILCFRVQSLEKR